MMRPQTAADPFEVIVVGGSAGALDALIDLLSHVPDLTSPIVVVLHLARHRRSHLPDVLTSSVGRRVVEAEDKMPLDPAGVYVAPPDYHLLIDDGPALALSVELPQNYSIPSIDVLFESAADVLGARAVGVLLSGANEDGARGLQAILNAGGRALVQSPDEATSSAMPRAALSRNPGVPSLAVRDIAARLRSPEQGAR